MSAPGSPSGGSESVFAAIAEAARYPRPRWRSERAYVFAAVAGVVGLGNIWRFPYMAGLYGGGSFLVAYAVCVALMAVPLAILEGAAGRVIRRSPVGVMRRAGGRWGAALGWAVVGVTVAIMSYYFVVTGWTLGYALDALRGELVTFRLFVQGMASLWLFLAVCAAVYFFVLRDVRSIERASLFLVPVLVVAVVALAGYAMTLDGAGEARGFYLGVDGARLRDPLTWQAAAGQSFYSLGVGQGVLIAYGSFVPAGTNLVRATAQIAAANSAVSVIAGLMVMGVVFTFGIPVDSGSELSFTAFPRVFPQLPSGAALAVVFFTLLFLAGFTSCLSGVVVAVSVVRDEFRYPLRRATALVVGGIAVLGVPSALSFTSVGLDLAGRPFLEWVDLVTGSGVLIALGLAGALLLRRGLSVRRLVAGANMDRRRLGRRSVGPGLVLWWAGIIPFVAVCWYAVSFVL